MDLFTIDQEKCNQDGICAAVCPVAVIDFKKGQFPRPLANAAELCLGCGHCVAVCPTAALDHLQSPLADCQPLPDKGDLGLEQIKYLLCGRRSIRCFKDRQVPKEVLRQLLEIAFYAPSGHNSQPFDWLVYQDRDELHRLAGLVVDWMRMVMDKNPAMAQTMHLDAVIALWDQGIDRILRDTPSLVVAYGDKSNIYAPPAGAIAISYLETSAFGLGLGACWAGYFNRAAQDFPPLVEALGLPQGKVTFGALMVGYPRFSYKRLPVRKTPKVDWR